MTVRSFWRPLARRLAAAPGFRLLAPGWPDAGRRVVQTPALSALLSKAAGQRPAVQRVANAGAGEGLYTPLLRRRLPAAQIFEFDLAAPPGVPAPGVSRFAASVTSIPLPSQSIDLVVCTEVLEHIPDDRRAVAELRRILADDGALIMSVPTPPAVPDPAHVREGYTVDHLSRLLGRHGLRVTEIRFCMHALFKLVLRWWTPYRIPRGAIVALARLDRLLRLGAPMDLLVLAQVDRELTRDP